MIYQTISLSLCSEVKKYNIPRPYTTVSKFVIVGMFREENVPGRKRSGKKTFREENVPGR
jgi:hypothetical protein